MAAPVLSMTLGSAAVSMGEPSEQMQARLQHLSAGVLVGAVITEIFPILKERLFQEADTGRGHEVSWSSLLAAAVGFAAALIFMYSIKALDLGAEGDDEAEDSKWRRSVLEEALLAGAGAAREERARLRVCFARLQAHSKALSKLVESDEVDREAVDEEVHGIDFLVDSARRVCRGADPLDHISVSQLRLTVGELIGDIQKLRQMDVEQLSDLDRQLVATGRTLRLVHSQTERGTFRRWAPRHLERRASDEAEDEKGKQPSVPWGLIVAVVVDAVIDGMLIGLAGSVAYTSGMLMALATAIEMGFLGYSFACSLTKSVQRCTSVIVLGLPPLAMLGAAAGAAAGATYVEHMAAFCGLVAFALVAVLFLVVQELLVEAHEKEEGEAWHISVWLYVGLLLSITLDVLL